MKLSVASAVSVTNGEGSKPKDIELAPFVNAEKMQLEFAPIPLEMIHNALGVTEGEKQYVGCNLRLPAGFTISYDDAAPSDALAKVAKSTAKAGDPVNIRIGGGRKGLWLSAKVAIRG